MNMRDLQPASALALRLGCKCVGYGPPGGGKTPLSNTAPRPVMCVTEPGMLSMRNSNIPAFPAFTAQKINEFFGTREKNWNDGWFFASSERKNFDTIILDSVSQMAEIFITDAQAHNKHGLKAYGEANEKVMDILTALYYLQQCHVYVICKQETYNDNGNMMKRPYLPGKELPIKVPHLFDVVFHVAPVSFPEGVFNVLRCRANYEILARDRSGFLAEYEAFDLASIFKKMTQ